MQNAVPEEKKETEKKKKEWCLLTFSLKDSIAITDCTDNI